MWSQSRQFSIQYGLFHLVSCKNAIILVSLIIEYGEWKKNFITHIL